ncbi:MAG: exonuclease SbcC [Candidatus Endobugula sp.]|jgi:exonuclease SbcC
MDTMKKLRQLFAKKSASLKLADDIQAVKQQSPEALEVLLAECGSAIELRIEALQYLPYSVAMRQAAISVAAPVQKAACLRLAALVDSKAVSISQLIDDIGDPERLLAIAEHCNQQVLQNAVLDTIQNQRVLADICLQSTSAAVRKIVAERIEAVVLLDELLAALKNKDKTAYNIIKSKVNHIKAQKNAVTKSQQKIDALCADMEEHSHHAFDKDYAARLTRLALRWVDLESIADVNNQQRYQQAQVICQQKVDVKDAEIQAKNQYHHQMSTVNSQRQSLLQQLWLYINTLYALPVIKASISLQMLEQQQELQAKWIELSAYGYISADHFQHYTQLCELAENLFQQYQERGTLSDCHARLEAQLIETPSNSTSTNSTSTNSTSTVQTSTQDIDYLRLLLRPIDGLSAFLPGEQLAAYRVTLQAIDKKNEQQQQYEQKQWRSMSRLIRQGHIAIAQGQLKKAFGIHHAIEEKLAAGLTLPPGILQQQKSLSEAVQKLLDWQDYAVLPKQQELINAMKKLIDVSMSPEVLAGKIKTLQHDWKQLKQRGGDSKQELWEQFSQAADEAYIPCKQYFQQLSIERQQDIAKQESLVQQLEDYYQQHDWGNTNWKQVEQVLRIAKKELHQYMPNTRSGKKSTSPSVFSNFNNITQLIQEKLDTEWASNKTAKLQLIQQAEKLVLDSDIDNAVKQAKQLQAQWKMIARCHYRENEKLWRDFHQHCQQIFKNKAQREADDQNACQLKLSNASADIEKMTDFLDLAGEELLAKRDAFLHHSQECEQIIAELPKHMRHDIDRMVKQKNQQFEKKISQTRSLLEQSFWQYMFAITEKINAYQQALSASAPTADTLLQALMLDVDQQSYWVKGGLAAIKDKIAQLSTPSTSDSVSRHKALTLLCIRAEILADKVSPKEDKEQRMEYQVNRLQQGLSGSLSVSDTPVTLALAWVAVEAVDEASYQHLSKRFQHCWQLLPVKEPL